MNDKLSLGSVFP